MTADSLAISAIPRRPSTNAEIAARAIARHRHYVIAESVPDLVRAVGGWLTDRALAGWDIHVFVPDIEDIAPLQILGLTPRRLVDILPAGAPPELLTALAVSAGIAASNPKVQQRLAAALAGRTHEVTMWGAAVPEKFCEQFQLMQHIPSHAARAFKSHALRGVGIDDHSSVTAELFHVGPKANQQGKRPQLAVSSGVSVLPSAEVGAPPSDFHAHGVAR